MAEGIDVSRHQGDIHWGAARASGIEFAYIKVTEGVGYVDPRVDKHLTGARQSSVVPGLYHFGRPDTNTGAQDGEHFANELNARSASGPGNLPPCLDLEETKPGQFAGLDLISWTSDFLATARRLTGRRQFILYGSSSFIRDRLGGVGWLDKDCLLWIAHYGRNPGDPGFKDDRTVIHQYTSTGRVDGYTADIDRNVCWVDLTTLTAGGGVPAPPVEPPAPPPAPSGDYKVKRGDTLSGIAAKLNFPGGWKALYDLNRDVIGSNPDKIKVGTVLRTAGAPAGKPEYEVKSGDNLSKIATSQNVAGGWQAIYNANRDRIKDPDILFPGQKLRLP